MRVPSAAARAVAAEAALGARERRESVSQPEPVGSADDIHLPPPSQPTIHKSNDSRTQTQSRLRHVLRLVLVLLVPALACLPVIWIVAPLDTSQPLIQCTVQTDGFDFFVHGVVGLSLIWVAVLRRYADTQGGLPRSNIMWWFDVAQPLGALAALHLANSYYSVVVRTPMQNS